MRGVRRQIAKGVSSGGHPVQGLRVLRDRFPCWARGAEGRVEGRGERRVHGRRRGRGIAVLRLLRVVPAEEPRSLEGVEEGHPWLLRGAVGLNPASPGQKVRIGVLGGSGFYSFLDDAQVLDIQTPYGSPSAPVTIGSV